MRKVLVATEKPFAKTALDGIAGVFKEAGYEMVLLENYKDPADLLKAAADAEAMIVRSDLVSREVIAAAYKLKIVIRAGAGYDNIDLVSANDKNVAVMNTPGQNSNAVAELALGMMIYMARNQFNGTSGTELRGKDWGFMRAAMLAGALPGLHLGSKWRYMDLIPLLKDLNWNMQE